MTCNYNKNLPHIQILSHPNSKIGNFSSSNPITTDYAKSKWSGLGANDNVEILGNVQVVSGQDKERVCVLYLPCRCNSFCILKHFLKESDCSFAV